MPSTSTCHPVTDAGAWMRDLHARVLAWHDRYGDYRATARTAAYLRLLFACGFARLGLPEPAREFRRAADRELSGEGEAHDLLLAGFTLRIEQALAGAAWEEPLPPDWEQRREGLAGLSRSAVDCLLEGSRVLTPVGRAASYFDHGSGHLTEAQEKLNSCTAGQIRATVTEAAKAWRSSLTGSDRNSHRIRGLFGYPGYQDFQAKLLRHVLRRRQAEIDVAEEVLRLVLEWTDAGVLGTPEEVQLSRAAIESTNAKSLPSLSSSPEAVALHEAAIDVIRRYDFRTEFFALLTRVREWCRTSQEPGYLLSEMLRLYVRGLFRLNLPEEADQFLEAASRFLCRGSPMEEWLARDESTERCRLRCMLALANGWHAFGWGSLSRRGLELALPLLDPQSRPLTTRANLATAMVESLWLSDQPFAAERLAWLMEGLPSLRDTFPTAAHFARFVVGLAESVVTTAVEVCRRR